MTEQFELKGQIYKHKGYRGWICRDGKPLLMSLWETACPVCQALHTVMTKAAGFDPAKVRRRCDACKRPGRMRRGEARPLRR